MTLRIEVLDQRQSCGLCALAGRCLLIEIGRQNLRVCVDRCVPQMLTRWSTWIALTLARVRCACCEERVIRTEPWSPTHGETDTLCLRCQLRLHREVAVVRGWAPTSVLTWEPSWEAIEPKPIERRERWRRAR